MPKSFIALSNSGLTLESRADQGDPRLDFRRGRFRRRVAIDFDELKLAFDERIERGLHAIGLPRWLPDEPQAHRRVHVRKRDGRSGDDSQHAIDDLRAEADAGGQRHDEQAARQRKTIRAQKACPRLK